MDIAGRHDSLQHEAVPVTGRMRFIRKLLLVFAFYEQAALRVRNALCRSAFFLLLPAGQLLLRGIVFWLLWGCRMIVVVIKGLPAMRFSVCVDLLHQLFRIVSGGCRNLFLHLLFRVGVGLDVGAVNKDGPRRQIACFRHFAQNPCKYLVCCFRSKAMPEVIAHCRKMRRFLLQRIAQKPAVTNVCADLIRRPPQGRQAVQMLDQDHLEQHHRIDAGPPVIFAIERLRHFIQRIEINRCIYFSKQLLRRYQLVYYYKLHSVTVHFSSFQHLFITRFYFTISL